VLEAEQALAHGARELDMVLNIGRLRSGLVDEVRDDIARVARVAQADGAIVKVILENAYLDDGEKELGCRLAEEAGAAFVKTSTGFAGGGATIEDLKLMRRTVGPQVQVKAAGGVRTLDALFEVMAVGVTRIGATATEAILEDFKARKAAGEPAVAAG
jgi:deoxyribose-phosphate aldolase